jgi:hypothetical protein
MVHPADHGQPLSLVSATEPRPDSQKGGDEKGNRYHGILRRICTKLANGWFGHQKRRSTFNHFEGAVMLLESQGLGVKEGYGESGSWPQTGPGYGLRPGLFAATTREPLHLERILDEFDWLAPAVHAVAVHGG